MVMLELHDFFSQHDGKIPANYKEKNEFKALIKTGA